jgi:hypothetical protein
MINSNNININQDRVPMTANKLKLLYLRSKRKQLFGKCLLLSLLIYVALISFCVWNNIITRQMKKDLIEFKEMTQRTKTNHTQTVKLTKQLQDIFKQIERKGTTKDST